MDADRYQHLRALFAELSAYPADERDKRLREIARDDAEIAERLRSLLANHDRPAEVLDFDDDTPASLGAAPLDPKMPERIGPYQIEAELGQGGMGIVYRGVQSSPERSVAIKVLRPGLLADITQRRFAQEVQVMALLNHPGIAKIYEAGECDLGFGAQPFFAMEFVQGQTLRRAAATRSIEQRCELVARIADALQHAHEKGIVHRDVKPENVVVEEPNDDEVGQPKLLDFGIARTSDGQRLAEGGDTLTGHGAVIGTIAYMSPEQLSAGVASPASDVYALGVVLYELLIGRLPLQLANKTLSEALHIVQNIDPPRLATDRHLSADLNVIVRTAMAKESELRYRSAGEMAADLRRMLAGEPIQARPQTTWYRLHKFAIRNRALAFSFAALVTTLVTATAVTIYFANVARENERIANQNEHEANQNAARAEQRAYAGRMLAASAQVDVDPYSSFAQLAATEPEQRGFEHEMMTAMLDSAERLDELPPSTPCAFTYLPTGDAVVAIASGREITVREWTTGRELAQLTSPADIVRFWLSPDASRIGIISQHRDKGCQRIVAMSVADGEVIYDVTDARLQVLAMHFSPDARFLMTRYKNRNDASIVVDLQQRSWQIVANDGHNRVHNFVPDGSGFVIKDVRYSLPEFREVGKRTGGNDIYAPSPNGRHVAETNYYQRNVFLREPRLGLPGRSLLTHRGRINDMLWTADGAYLVSGSASAGEIAISDPFDERLLRMHRVPYDRPTRLALHPDGANVLARTSRGIEELPLLRTGRVLGPHREYLTGCAFSADGGLLATCDTAGRICLWHVDGAEKLCEYPDFGRDKAGTLNGPFGIAFAADGLSVRCAVNWERIFSQDLVTGRSFKPIRLYKNSIDPSLADDEWQELATGSRLTRGYAVSNDGNYVVWGPSPKHWFHWTEGHLALSGRQPDGSWQSLSTHRDWRADADLFARTGTAGTIARRLANGREQEIAVAFDRASTRMATGHAEGIILIHELPSCRIVQRLEGHIGPVLALTWTHDGRLVSGGRDGALSFWDVDEGNRLAWFHEHQRALECLAVSPDGSRIASASADGTVRLWDTRPIWQRKRDAQRIQALEPTMQVRVTSELARGDRSAAFRAIWTDPTLSLEQRQAARNLILRTP